MSTRSLHIAEKFSLPLDLVTSTLIVYGGKGMGKTNLGRVLAEELSRAGLRWSYLDPLGVAWGLRHSADGKGPGVECVILGGAHGDIPIEPTGGAVVADLVVDEPANVIIDFSRKSNGQMYSIGEKIRFITDYAYRIFQRQGELDEQKRRREPFFQILDEAARYIPQIIPAGNPDLAKCVSAWEQLVEEGRNVGIGVGLLTQRSARMNKSVSELADAVFAFRTVGPRSISAIMDWLGEHVEKEKIRSLVETVRSLDRGKALVVSPGWLKFEEVVTIRLAQTFDSSATPKPGERPRKITGAPAKPDLAKYSSRMLDTIERAKSEDPRELRAKIKDLEKQLAKPSKAIAPAADPGKLEKTIEAAVRKALRERDLHWTRSLRDYQRATEKAIGEATTKLSGAVHMVKLELPPAIGEISVELEKSIEASSRMESPRPVPAPRPFVARPPKPSNGDDNGVVSRSQSRILEALALFRSLDRVSVPKKWIAAVAGASHSSSTFSNNLGALRTNGYIDYPEAGSVALTAKGGAIAPQVEAPSSPAEMLERCRSIVSGSQFRILEELAKKYPNAIDKTDLAARVGASATSSTYSNNLGALRSAGMIDYPSQGQAKASAWLFLES